MASVIETIYTKFCNGDSLTDTDLDIGIKHFDELATLLMKSGPVFRLAASEALRVMMRFEEFRTARSCK